MALIGPAGEPRTTLQDLLDRREGLLRQLKQAHEAGDLDTAAVLEFRIAEYEGLIALGRRVQAKE